MNNPCGTYSETYAKDVAIVRTNLQWGLLITLIVFLFIVPFFLSDYTLQIATTGGITLIAVLGLNILTGYCGLISMGHAAFMGVGAYTAAILSVTYGLSFWITLPCAGIAAGIAGMIVGIPALRVKGFYLIMVTLAVQFLLIYVVYLIPDLTGGADGLRIGRPSFAGMTLNTHQDFYLLVLVMVIIMTFFAKNIARTRAGRAFIAIRDNDLSAEVMGINLFRYKILAFFIGCFFAGIAGCLLIYQVRYIHPDYFNLSESIMQLGALIIGGMGSITGAIWGVIFLEILDMIVSSIGPMVSEAFPALGFAPTLGPIVSGLVIVLFIVFEPRGLAHRWEIIKNSYRVWPYSYGGR
ncbi:MAG: branched-chain amino acid ABC transporter permease [Chloroflexota bacterium]|nr:branched-chain amino acid ABC transporter permease [Chloroflexota bacterium]